MNMDRNTILAFLFIGLILIMVNTPMYQKTFNPKGWEAKQKALQQMKQGQVESVTQDSLLASQPNTQAQEIVRITEPEPETTRPSTILPDVSQQDIPEKTVSIETDFIRANISSIGGVLSGWELITFDDHHGNPVQMLPDHSNSTLGIQFATPEGDTLDTSTFPFTLQGPQSIVLHNEESKSVKFVMDLGNDRQLVKEYTFYNKTYHFDLNVYMINMQDIITGKTFFISAQDGLLPTEDRIKDDMQYSKAGYAAGGEISKKFKANGKIYKESATIDWIGVRTKYFTLAIIPRDSKGQSAIIAGEEFPIPNDKQKSKWRKYNITMSMPYSGDPKDVESFQVYLGPLDNDILKSYDVHLEKFMDFGMKVIQPFSIAILWSFKKLHTVIPNYGWVIIIFSIMIKIIVYPLTHKSYESMQRMQALQPKLSELKEKYSNDPKKLNELTMKMYKDEKVNPLGGCLPTLLQLPLLYGLFTVFRSTIELRGEGFIWWIKDLSAPDTIATLPFVVPMYGDSVNILPLFMGVTMFLQQKLTITDPKQKMMVYFMPLFLTLLFNQFPSGLNLYYALFNLLSIIQQKWLVPRHATLATSTGSLPKQKKM